MWLGSSGAGFDDDLGLRDGHGAGRRDDGVEVLRRVAVDQVAVGVGGVGVHQGDVGLDGAFLDESLAVELRERFAFGDEGADAGLGVEGRDAGAAGAEALGQGALRGELHLQLAGEVLLGEELVLAHVGGDDLADLAGFNQHAEALAVHAHVVGDHGEVLDARIAHRLDQVGRDAAEAKASDGERHAVPQYVLQRGGRSGFHL